MKRRNMIIAMHGWVGLIAGLLIVVVSLTGAAIVFHEELDHHLNRSLYFVTPQSQQVSLDQLVATAQATHPDWPMAFIQTPNPPDASYVINQSLPNHHRWQTFVDPYTGKILGQRVWEHSFVGFMYAVHHDLLAGQVGQILVGVTGLFLLFMAITGVMLWTGWRKLVAGFKIRWGAAPSLLSYDLHNVGGILSNAILSILAFTGGVIVILHFLPMFNPPTSTKPLPKQSPVALSQLLQTADTALLEGKTTLLEFSEAEPEKLVIRKKLPQQETGKFDLSTVEVDRYSGKVTNVTRVVKPEGLFQFIVTIATLHFGTFGGLPTRILYVFVGLMPTVLFMTGLVNWRRRRWLGNRREIALQLAPEMHTPSQPKP